MTIGPTTGTAQDRRGRRSLSLRRPRAGGDAQHAFKGKTLLVLVTVMLVIQMSLLAQPQGMLVRVSEIQVYPTYLDEYTAILKEEAEASVRLERGVVAIFPMHQKESPTTFSILEIYASRDAYESHLKTPHFQRYKTTTLKMVKSLELVDMEAIDAETMTSIFDKMGTRR